MNELRLQKYISMSGITSRRKAEELISAGRVKVNGKVIKTMGYKVSKADFIVVDDKKISIKTEKIYIMLNKPEGCVTTASDQFGRETVLDIVDIKGERLFPVGRLDYSTSGLLIITNDGDVAFKLTHPKNKIEKSYLVKAKGDLSMQRIEKLSSGMVVDGYKTNPAKVKLIETYDDKCLFTITINEGKNKQVRKMCEQVKLDIERLKRISIGKLNIGTLRRKSWRYLKEPEIKYLQSL